jgi:hypothetical protein
MLLQLIRSGVLKNKPHASMRINPGAMEIPGIPHEDAVDDIMILT